jgi:ATP-dependent Clp protease protease subunit
MSNFDMYNFKDKDFFSKTRTIFLYGEVNMAMAYDIGCRIKYLDYINSSEPITIEINSPGGEVSSGLAIIDTMNYVESPIKTVVCGMAASMGAVIAAAGTKGMRYALPHSKVMIHQPLGGFGVSQASDIEIYARNILQTRRELNELLAEACGKSIEEIERDTDRDYYMTALEAKEYGLIDGIITPRKGERQ